MKRIIYIIIFLMLTSCTGQSKQGEIKDIENNKNYNNQSDPSISNIGSKEFNQKPKSPVLKDPPFKPRDLDYTIIKPSFLLERRFKDLKTQDKYGTMMVEYYDPASKVFYVSKILNNALKDPMVNIEDNFDDKMSFTSDLFLLSPFYSRGELEADIYSNYWFDEQTFTLKPKYAIEEDTKTYINDNEQALVDNQIDILIDYANQTYDNDYDKAYYFAQWLAENNDYQYQGDKDNLIENNMYGALVKGLSQCSGFSQSFTILCQKVGIQAYSITGNTEEKQRPDDYSGEHQWNVIKLGDTWSYVDVTGMVANGKDYYYYYFDRSNNDFKDYYISQFFNDIRDYVR